MKYSQGDIVKGNVVSIKPYGAFISLEPGISGLLHISEISHDYVKDVNNVLKIGDQIELKIISIDVETKQIIFSKRSLLKPKRKTKTRSRYKQSETIMETKKGFKDLKRLMPLWIAGYNGGNNDKI